LQAEYLDLINTQLPEKAKKVTMPVRLNHCFGRIILDNLFKDCWYNQLSRKQPAYKQISESQLEQAIALAKSMIDYPETAKQLNDNSLRWRGKFLAT
jgi:tRNA A22 N-methylase